MFGSWKAAALAVAVSLSAVHAQEMLAVRTAVLRVDVPGGSLPISRLDQPPVFGFDMMRRRKSVPSTTPGIDRGFKAPGEHRQAANMVAVLMSDEKSRDVDCREPQFCHAL